MGVQMMPDRRQPVGGAFQRLGKLEHGQDRFAVRFPTQRQARDRALRLVGRMLEVHEAPGGRERVLAVGAIALP
jgi:hypothetical protein